MADGEWSTRNDEPGNCRNRRSLESSRHALAGTAASPPVPGAQFIVQLSGDWLYLENSSTQLPGWALVALSVYASDRLGIVSPG